MSDRSPSARPCPLCGKPPVERFRPFCSKRCSDLDLARWLKGDYAIAAREAPEGEEEGDDGPSEEEE